MTLEQLRAMEGMMDMLTSQPFKTLMAYLRDECPYVGKETLAKKNDLIRNEGCLQGWLRCVRIADNIRHSEKKKEEPKEEVRPIYPDPMRSETNQPAPKRK